MVIHESGGYLRQLIERRFGGFQVYGTFDRCIERYLGGAQIGRSVVYENSHSRKSTSEVQSHGVLRRSDRLLGAIQRSVGKTFRLVGCKSHVGRRTSVRRIGIVCHYGNLVPVHGIIHGTVRFERAVVLYREFHILDIGFGLADLGNEHSDFIAHFEGRTADAGDLCEGGNGEFDGNKTRLAAVLHVGVVFRTTYEKSYRSKKRHKNSFHIFNNFHSFDNSSLPSYSLIQRTGRPVFCCSA